MKRIPTVQDAMEQRGLQVHGWVYDVSNGHINPMKTSQDANQAAYELSVSDGALEWNLSAKGFKQFYRGVFLDYSIS